jgi:hypothetical protein
VVVCVVMDFPNVTVYIEINEASIQLNFWFRDFLSC